MIYNINFTQKKNYFYVERNSSDTPWEFRRHSHKGFCDLTYIHRGEMLNEVNGKKIILTEGDLLWVRERDIHMVAGSSFSFTNINFDENFLLKFADVIDENSRIHELYTAKIPEKINIPLGQREHLKELLEKLFLTQNSQSSIIEFYKFMTFLLTDIIGLDGWATKKKKESQPIPHWLKDLMEYINNHVESLVEISTLGKIAGLSQEHVSRSFKKYLGKSPSAYINDCRLARAALLLTNSNRAILDICYSLNFNSPAYFYRLFGEKYGMPPKKYRLKFHMMFS